MAHVKIRTTIDWVDLTAAPATSPISGERTLFFLNGILSAKDDEGNIAPISSDTRAEVALEATDFTDGAATISASAIPFSYDYPEITVYEAGGNLIQVGISVDGTLHRHDRAALYPAAHRRKPNLPGRPLPDRFGGIYGRSYSENVITAAAGLSVLIPSGLNGNGTFSDVQITLAADAMVTQNLGPSAFGIIFTMASGSLQVLLANQYVESSQIPRYLANTVWYNSFENLARKYDASGTLTGIFSGAPIGTFATDADGNINSIEAYGVTRINNHSQAR
ncbi:MAG: hypothetical protein LBD72_00330 [Puniceicoccales bacterium]|jgi:hypothetical protein|nr:hypothetical protein [Puniceicoccales bacterium]